MPEFEEWLNSYKPAELFNADGSLKAEIAEMAPRVTSVWLLAVANGGRRRGDEPTDLTLPNWKDFANEVTADNRGTELPEGGRNMDMNLLSTYFAAVSKLTQRHSVSRPDETMSNRLWEMFKITDRQWMEEVKN